MQSTTTRWFDILPVLHRKGDGYVVVTVIGAIGSTPRDSGTKMVVDSDNTYDTIGGGHLEFKAIAKAREMLSGTASTQLLEHFPLAAKLGQCCGGQATLLFEYFAPQGVVLALFGAGHVGKALVQILGDLPLRVKWIDNREQEFPTELPSNVQQVLTDDPVAEVQQLPPNSFYLVMTHNHGLDFDIVSSVLKRKDSHYLGVIGSDNKAKRFKQRLTHRDFTEQQIAHMRSPVGLPQVPGKLPMEVAVSIAGELIAEYQSMSAETPSRQGLQWPELQALLVKDSES